MEFSAHHLLWACILDLCLGDPTRLPHPVRWIGWGIERLERLFHGKRSPQNEGTVSGRSLKGGAPDWRKRFWGTVLWIAVSGATALSVSLILAISEWIAPMLAAVFAVWLAYTTLACRCLYEETRAVARLLRRKQISEARQRLSFLVSRDTEHLEEPELWRALLETMSENLSDGVVAPLFYLALAGPVGGMVYKAVNTMDSMLGYKNDRYRDFGWCAARMDDLFNWIPARITAGFLLLAGAVCGMDWRAGWAVMKRDAKKSASPNAGYPEAAAAGLLGVRLGGGGVYFGVRVEKAVLGDGTNPTDERAYDGMVRMYWTASVGAMVLASFFRLLMQWG